MPARRRAQVHDQFRMVSDVTPLKKKRVFACIHCGEQFAENTTRQTKHLQTCMKYIATRDRRNASTAIAVAQRMAPTLFPPRVPLAEDMLKQGIEAALLVQRRAVSMGKRPFAAVLVGPDNRTVLLSHQSLDQVRHAEGELARLAYCHYEKEFLWRCTLFSTWEPCAMCTSTIFWSHIGRIVYAASNEQLLSLTGPGNKENFTMTWNCRDILKGQQKDIEVIGPVRGLDGLVMGESDAYWRNTRPSVGQMQGNNQMGNGMQVMGPGQGMGGQQQMMSMGQQVQQPNTPMAQMGGPVG